MELTGDDGIFPHLHKYFVFLLKAGGLRITECVLEGPPRVKNVYSECVRCVSTVDNYSEASAHFCVCVFVFCACMHVHVCVCACACACVYTCV